MLVLKRLIALAAAFPAIALGAGPARADGLALPWQLGFQQSASPVMDEIVWFHDWILMGTITAITLFVLGLLVIVAVRFNARSNPVPPGPPTTR